MQIPDRKLTYCPPESIRDHWPIVRDGLLKVKDHSVDRWIPEDVYLSLVNRTATLHIAYVDEIYSGFVITQRIASYGSEAIHVWAAYSNSDVDILESSMEDIKRWAMEINSNRITFTSPRKGWERRGKLLGFKPVSINFECEVQS